MFGDFELFGTCHSIFQFYFLLLVSSPSFCIPHSSGFLGVLPLLSFVKIVPTSWLSVFPFPFMPVFVIEETW
jgi:hypothetical protein